MKCELCHREPAFRTMSACQGCMLGAAMGAARYTMACEMANPLMAEKLSVPEIKSARFHKLKNHFSRMFKKRFKERAAAFWSNPENRY